MEEVIKRLKKEHRDIYQITYGDQIFIYRPLKRKEWKDLVESDMTQADLEDEVCKACVLYPENYDFDNSLAGLATAIGNAIAESSMVLDQHEIEDRLDEYRFRLKQGEWQMELLIKSAFPDIRFEEMGEWTQDKFIEMYAKAEWVLVNMHGIPLDTGDGSDEAGDGHFEEFPAEVREQLRQAAKQKRRNQQ